MRSMEVLGGEKRGIFLNPDITTVVKTDSRNDFKLSSNTTSHWQKYMGYYFQTWRHKLSQLTYGIP